MSNEPWFIVPPAGWVSSLVTLDAEESHHALKVLRVRPPDVITVTDGRGLVARCAVVATDGGRVVAEVLERDERRRPVPEIVVYQGAAKGTKNDDVIERLAELGVAECHIFSSTRSVVRWDEAKSARLAGRWATIARSAAKQSRSPHLLDTGPPLGFDALLQRVGNEQLSLALWERATVPLRSALVAAATRVALIVGPEGGLTEQEAESLADGGAALVSLGPQILRTENAAFAAATAVAYHYRVIG